MSALRLARGYTGRDLIIKFEGCYHGHADSLLVKAGSGLLTFADSTQNAPSSGGVPQDLVKHTLVLPYNDVEAIAEVFKKQGDQIAAVIIEPIAGNMNLIQPSKEFLSTIRNLTSQYGSVLIYDEVMTGFRVALGGAQSLQGIVPDLTCLGKVMGGGMPMATGAAIGAPGRRVLNLQADGSAMYTVQALWTQAREKLDVTTVIFSNRKYAILLGELANVGANPGRTALDMMDLGNPDINWPGMANAMGVEAARTDSAEGFADLLSYSLKRPGPFLIELVI